MIAAESEAGERRQIQFQALLVPVLSAAYGTAVRLTRDRTEAEDLIQDASLLAFRGFDSFEAGSNFRAWYFKILLNAFYSRYRKGKHDRSNLSTEDILPGYLYRRSREMGLDLEREDPASAIMDRLDTEQVAEALNQLPEEYRVVATLYFMEDLSYQQIADAVGCPVGTVRSRLHRGRRMLQKALWALALDRGIAPGARALH